MEGVDSAEQRLVPAAGSVRLSIVLLMLVMMLCVDAFVEQFATLLG